MNTLAQDNCIRVSDAQISLEHTFSCGQCFRWEPGRDGSFTGVALGRAVRVWTEGEDLYLRCTEEEYQEVWAGYFDLDRDYRPIAEGLARDEFMRRAVEHGWGLRILRQEPWEALCTFIFSQCNHIPRIRQIVDRLCRLCGEELKFEGERHYAFPGPERVAALSGEELGSLRAGYRAPYVREAAQALALGQLDLAELREGETDVARQALMALNGVGRKVADCVLLFGLNKLEAFPVDTWMKKAEGLHPDCAGPYAGIAQQYIFYYMREKGIDKGRQKSL